MYRRRARRQPEPVRPSAVHEMLSAEGFHDLPFGGHAGEMIVHASSEPTPQAGSPLRIDPPPWQDSLAAGELDLSAFSPPPALAVTDGLNAVERMKLADDDGEWPAPPGPPLVMPPLVRPALPEPDWRGEHEAHRRLQCEIDDEGT